MTAYEINMTIIGMLSLLITSGMFIIALLAYLEKKNKHKK